MLGPLLVAVSGLDLRIDVPVRLALMGLSACLFRPRSSKCLDCLSNGKSDSLRDTLRLAPFLFVPVFIFGFLHNGFPSLVGPWALESGKGVVAASALTWMGFLGLACSQIPLAILIYRTSTFGTIDRPCRCSRAHQPSRSDRTGLESFPDHLCFGSDLRRILHRRTGRDDKRAPSGTIGSRQFLVYRVLRVGRNNWPFRQ